ncbi:MAG: transcriptional regulator GcvA [SAR324 cluster bacterium]|jgi:LysR family glycine cleavage system transcriptional activator|nr:transcriptional regulator GcvA [SAR324 cluster bacterium]
MDNLKGLPSLNFLHTFESVARHLSFTNAAKELFVTQAAVSHQIKALEDYLGVKLFYREKRKVFLSDEGQKLLPSVVSGLQGIADSLENIRNYDSEDTIVVGVGSSFSANWLVHRLGAFYQKFPEVNLHLKIFNNESDFNSGGTDIAVVWGIGDWQGLMCEKLMVVEFTPVCSPELIKKTHPLETPEDLIHYPLLDDPDYDIWQQWLEEAGIPERKYKRRTVIRDANVVIHSTLEGHGIAICAVGIVQEYLDSGRLIRPFDHSITGGGFYYLVYPEKALRKPPVRLFKTWLVQEVRKAESMDPSQGTL